MKKILAISSFLCLGGVVSYGQFQANMSNVGNHLTFKLKPTVTTNTNFSVIEFFVRYPSASPAFIYGPIVENTTNFPGMTDFTVQAEAAVGGFKYDHFIYTAPGPVTTPKDYTAGQEYEVFTVDLLGSGTVDLEFVHNESIEPAYLAITNGNGADIATPDPANYFYPSTDVSGTAGSRLYKQALAGVLLPVKFLSFYALKSGDDAKLSWTVSKDLDNKYFDVERSTDGRAFTAFTRVNALENGQSTNTYQAADGLLSKHGSDNIYYRIKQVDKTGGMLYSEIRKLDVGKSAAISLFPNPARSTSKLLVDAPTEGKASIIIRDATGRQLQIISTQFYKGVNQKDINVSMLPAGDYNITVIGERLNQTIKLSKTN